MAIYAACVAHMDTAVGRLVAALQERNVFDNTLIFFMSDNGGNAESGPNGRLEGKNPGAAYSTVYCGKSWATLENTPFRRYKHFNHEGGIATPLIVHWPEGIFGDEANCASSPATWSTSWPRAWMWAGRITRRISTAKPILPMEGRSLLPAFANKAVPRDALYWEHEGNAAVRVGDWKLVRAGRRGPWELYDMKADRTELHDLSKEQTNEFNDLVAKWQAWAERAHVKPYPAPRKAKQKKAADPADPSDAPKS